MRHREKGEVVKTMVNCRLMQSMILGLIFLTTASPAHTLVIASPQTQRNSVRESYYELTGVYQIDFTNSDKLYSVMAGASSNLPFGEQQRFFIDLAVRLTPPDLLAIECRGRSVSLASSRAARITFQADGVTQRERSSTGRPVRTRALLSRDSLTVDTSGGTDDSFSVTFKFLDAGRQVRVTRRITAPQLNEPIIVESIYNRISTVARWDIYGEPGNKPVANSVGGATGAGTPPANTANPEVDTLRTALNEWLQATNSRDVSKLISFYAPEIKAFYLTRNVSRAFVQSERSRTFRELSAITVSAEEPEVIFAGSEVAVMRFRKQYVTVRSGRTKQGTVIEELRWRKTGDGWKIFSERDVRVIR